MIGMGSLTAGGAATIGSGAFESVRAERDLSVGLADDANAYLSLDASISVYAEENNGIISLQFDGSNGGQNGDGLNDRADTTFANVFKLENQGTNEIRVQLGSDDQNPPIGQLPDGPMGVFFSRQPVTNAVVAEALAFSASPSPGFITDADLGSGDQVLKPGQDISIHFGLYLNEDIQSLGSGASTDLSDVPDDIGIYADSTPQSGQL
jgi:hypothetical protein